MNNEPPKPPNEMSDEELDAFNKQLALEAIKERIGLNESDEQNSLNLADDDNNVIEKGTDDLKQD